MGVAKNQSPTAAGIVKNTARRIARASVDPN